MKNVMSEMLSRAIGIASTAHAGQLDKGGHAYILHPMRVMMRLRTTDPELMAIAILHDVVEDCGITYAQLLQEGMTARVVDGVRLLTKVPGVSYEDFIYAMANNHDAVRVKLEDIKDNSDVTRLRGVTEKDLTRMNKYAKAYRVLQTFL